MEEFCRYLIPTATMKRKADEFRELQQENKSVEEYTLTGKTIPRKSKK